MKAKFIFKAITGSRLYGTAVPESDTDTRGIFIPPKEYFLGYLLRVEQLTNQKQGNVIDDTFYNIVKFFRLCIDANPNILELLFIPEDNWLVGTQEWKRIVANRQLFLSTKIKHTFAGYAVSQLKKIQTHRHWSNHPLTKPKRIDFGLPEHKSLVSQELIKYIADNSLTTDELSEQFIVAINKEKAYHNAKREWEAYELWKKQRNKIRAKLEEDFGYDTKHAMHLIRLISEGEELLRTGYITFPRPDAHYLLAIRKGALTYEQLLEIVGDVDEKLGAVLTSLPHDPERKKADKLCVDLVWEHFNQSKIC